MKVKKYKVGDEVTINKIKWRVESIRNRFGLMNVYDMQRKDTTDHFTIETEALETLLGDKDERFR